MNGVVTWAGAPPFGAKDGKIPTRELMSGGLRIEMEMEIKIV